MTSPVAAPTPQANFGVTGSPSTTQTFAASNVGVSSLDIAINVKNNGDAAGTLANPSLTGGNATDFSLVSNTCATSVPAGGSCAMTFRFTPAAAGTRTASVTVANTAFTLTGTGLQLTYAIWTDKGDSAATISADGLTVSAASYPGIRANAGKSSGKWYFEVTTNGNQQFAVGVVNMSANIGLTFPLEKAGNNGVGYYAHSSGGYGCTYTGCGVATNWPGSQTFGTTIGVALDLDGNTATWYYANTGAVIGTATVANSTRFAGLISTKASLPLYPVVNSESGNLNLKSNFGQTAFVMTPPAGYHAGWYQ